MRLLGCRGAIRLRVEREDFARGLCTRLGIGELNGDWTFELALRINTDIDSRRLGSVCDIESLGLGFDLREALGDVSGFLELCACSNG